MMKAIVVDDEWYVGEWLSFKLNETGKIQVEHILQNPLKVMEYIEANKIDVVFLDIEMPEMTGLELAEQLSMLESAPEIVFVTAHNNYAIEAFRVNALDYLLKPVHDRELQRVLTKVEKRLDLSKKEQGGKPADKTEQFFSMTDISLDFPTAKCEELFFYLLLKSKQPISKWEIIEDLWPGKEPEKGESNIRTTVFRLNQALENQGMDLRVKASKGYYHFIYVSNRNEQIVVQPFPPVETMKEIKNSIVEILQQYNFLQLIEKKDYFWAITLKQYETAYFQWAMGVIEQNREKKYSCLQAFYYLLERFPWQEQLIEQIMPLLLKVEGKGALIIFYQQQQERWKRLYGIPLSKIIQKAYQSLIKNNE